MAAAQVKAIPAHFVQRSPSSDQTGFRFVSYNHEKPKRQEWSEDAKRRLGEGRRKKRNHNSQEDKTHIETLILEISGEHDPGEVSVPIG